MALLTRVSRLERTARGRATPCPQCHAPAGAMPGMRQETPEGEPIGRRCACGFWLDDDGRAVFPIAPGGGGGFKVYGFDGLAQV